MEVEVARAAAIAKHAVGAAPRALGGTAHGEHHEVLRVQRRHGGGRQLRADRVHVEGARTVAVVHAANLRPADVAATTGLVGDGKVNRCWPWKKNWAVGAEVAQSSCRLKQHAPQRYRNPAPAQPQPLQRYLPEPRSTSGCFLCASCWIVFAIAHRWGWMWVEHLGGGVQFNHAAKR